MGTAVGGYGRLEVGQHLPVGLQQLELGERLAPDVVHDHVHPHVAGQVVEEEHEEPDRDQRVQQRDADGDLRHERAHVALVGADGAQDGDVEHPGSEHARQHHLGPPVPQERAEESRCELRRRHLQRHDRQREHDAGDREGGPGQLREDRSRPLGGPPESEVPDGVRQVRSLSRTRSTAAMNDTTTVTVGRTHRESLRSSHHARTRIVHLPMAAPRWTPSLASQD
jgi:hypothetical protein